MNQPISGNDNEFFYARSENPDYSSLVDAAVDKNIIGIHIEGPDSADFKMSDDIPVWGVRQESFFKAYHYRLDRLGVIVISHVQTSAFYTGEAFQQKGTLEPIEKKDEKEFRQGYSIDNFVIFPRQRIPKLKWYPGDYIIRLIAFKTISNPMLCTVPEQDGIITKKLDKDKFNIVENCIFEKNEKLPEVPKDFGIKTFVSVENEEAILVVSYSIPMDPEIIESDRELFVPVSILVTGCDQAKPVVFTVNIALNHKESFGKRLRGHFSFDLSRQSGFYIHSQKMVVYAFYREFVSEPCVFQKDLPGISK